MEVGQISIFSHTIGVKVNLKVQATFKLIEHEPDQLLKELEQQVTLGVIEVKIQVFFFEKSSNAFFKISSSKTQGKLKIFFFKPFKGKSEAFMALIAFLIELGEFFINLFAKIMVASRSFSAGTT